MKYSLSEAAKATGKNKTTIQRAIKSGKISACKGDRGSYEIDPSELHRVFPPAAAQLNAQHLQSNDTQQDDVAFTNSGLTRVLELEKELAVARERASGLEAQKDQMADTICDLRKRLDSAEGRVTALLSDDRPKRSSWWPWRRSQKSSLCDPKHSHWIGCFASDRMSFYHARSKIFVKTEQNSCKRCDYVYNRNRVQLPALIRRSKCLFQTLHMLPAKMDQVFFSINATNRGVCA